MKTLALLIIFALSMLNSCGGAAQPPQSNEVLKPAANSPIKGKTVAARGRVTRIERGKDGYTAEIQTDAGETYRAVISSINLAGQYREVQVGDTIAVEGEDALGDGKTVKVTSLK